MEKKPGIAADHDRRAEGNVPRIIAVPMLLMLVSVGGELSWFIGGFGRSTSASWGVSGPQRLTSSSVNCVNPEKCPERPRDSQQGVMRHFVR